MKNNPESVFAKWLNHLKEQNASLGIDTMPPECVYQRLYDNTKVVYNSKNLERAAIKSGIWQEYLVRGICKYDLNFFEAIPAIARSIDIFRVNRQHDPQADKTGTVEKRNCHWFCKNQQDKFPQIILYDREVPIDKQKTDREGATVDIVCTDNKPTPGNIDLVGTDNDEMVIIEYKAPSVPITPEVFNQIARYNMALHVKYLIVSNGLQHYCCKIDYNSGAIDFHKEIPSYAEIVL